MGIIVLAVAVLPMLGWRHADLPRGDAGPMKDSKLTRASVRRPNCCGRIRGLTAACIVCLSSPLIGSMPYAMGSLRLSLGGFPATTPASGALQFLSIEMVLNDLSDFGGANFATHYLAWSQRGVLAYFRDAEAKSVLGVLA